MWPDVGVCGVLRAPFSGRERAAASGFQWPASCGIPMWADRGTPCESAHIGVPTAAYTAVYRGTPVCTGKPVWGRVAGGQGCELATHACARAASNTSLPWPRNTLCVKLDHVCVCLRSSWERAAFATLSTFRAGSAAALQSSAGSSPKTCSDSSPATFLCCLGMFLCTTGTFNFASASVHTRQRRATITSASCMPRQRAPEAS